MYRTISAVVGSYERIQIDSYEFIMAALWNRTGHYFLPCAWFLSSIFFFPRLISAVGDWMSGLSANLECMSEMGCTRLAGNTGHKKSPFWHHRTTLSGYIFGRNACIGKNLLNSNTSSI